MLLLMPDALDIFDCQMTQIAKFSICGMGRSGLMMSKVLLQSTTVAHILSLQDIVLLSISKLALFEQQTA